MNRKRPATSCPDITPLPSFHDVSSSNEKHTTLKSVLRLGRKFSIGQNLIDSEEVALLTVFP
jgi:hypothetical protein